MHSSLLSVLHGDIRLPGATVMLAVALGLNTCISCFCMPSPPAAAVLVGAAVVLAWAFGGGGGKLRRLSSTV